MYEGFKFIGAGLSLISLGGVAIGIGAIFSACINGTARNPALKAQLTGLAFIGFALTEAIALFSLMIAFLILFG